MPRIVIAGSNPNSRAQLSQLLSTSGYPIYRTCSNAGELRRAMADCDDGLLICAGPLADCSLDELAWDCGDRVQILLIARQPALDACEAPDIFRLPLPASRQGVLAAVEMLSQLHQMRMPRRRGEDREIVERAKALLMARDHLTEPQAHRQLQQYAMDHGLRMADWAAQLIKGDGGTTHAG